GGWRSPQAPGAGGGAACPVAGAPGLCLSLHPNAICFFPRQRARLAFIPASAFASSHRPWYPQRCARRCSAPSGDLAMLVVMNSHATPEQIDAVVSAIRRMNLTPHPMPGATRTAIGITGNISAVDPRSLEVLPGVEEFLRAPKQNRLASREMPAADTYARTPQTTVGPGTFTLIAGPCSVENEEMILRTAEFLISKGVRLMRAGAFKPRTSPYAFQGMGVKGLEILARA